MIKILLLFLAIIFLLYASLLIFSFLRRKESHKRAVLTGGGSSGHIYPAIAIGRALEPDIEKFIYIGGKGRIEEQVVPKEKIPLKLICAAPYPSRIFQLPFFLLKLTFGIIQSSFHLLLFQPRFVIGTGGFVSAPVVFSSFILNSLSLLRAKIFLHEQNVTPGKLNLLASKIADIILVTFPQSIQFFGEKAVLIGYPVRKFKQEAQKSELLEKIKIPEGRKVVFAFGGSQGSRTINRAIVASLKYLLPYKEKIFVVLSCGLGQSGYNGQKDVEDFIEKNYNKDELSELKEFFCYKPYFYNINEIFNVASLVVARSGAGALFELASFELPSILIPKLGLSNEHQVMNAMAMEESGGSIILFEKPSFDNSSLLFVDGKTLAEKIIDIVFSEEKLSKMKEGTRKFIPSQDILESIRKIVLKGIEQKEDSSASSPFSKLKPPSRLLSFLQKEREKGKFEIENLFKDSEINFYKSLTLKLLFSHDWKERNIGVKLAAFFKTEESKQTLLEIVTNREKAPFINRILGEEFKNVGFLRRNSLLSLREYNIKVEELTKILRVAFSDPYYETRSAALLLAQKESAKLLSNREIIEFAKKLSLDSEFEVAKESILLLGEIGDEDALEHILSFKDHFFWQVREAALLAIRRIIERGVKIEKDKVKKELLKFNLTSTDFKPLFSIKQNYKKIFELLEKE